MLRFNSKPAEKYFVNIERVQNTFTLSYFLNSGWVFVYDPYQRIWDTTNFLFEI